MNTIDDQLPEGPISRKRETTKEIYEATVLDMIRLLKSDYEQALLDYNNVANMWNKYLEDRDRFRIKYFNQGDDILYEKNKRMTPGFKIPKKKKDTIGGNVNGK